MSSPDPFETTHGSLVVAAREPDAARVREALGALCQTYWPPIYAYIRRRGHDPEAAEDLTQAFFAELLRPGALAGVDRARGKFRAFLLAACTHFLGHAREHDRALKRGGDQTALSIDARDAEGRYRVEPSHDISPETLFHQRWALTLLEGVFVALRAEFENAGKSALFDDLKAHLTGDPGAASHAETAARHGMTEAAAQVAAHRLRRRIGACFASGSPPRSPAPPRSRTRFATCSPPCGWGDENAG